MWYSLFVKGAIIMQLEGRLKLIAELVPECEVLADVGTDHGYIPIYCVQNGMCNRAIAMDVNPLPLDRADAHIKKYDLDKFISTRLSDGVQQLSPDEADVIVIAGMGGQLIMNILDAGADIITEDCFKPESIFSFTRILYSR